MILTDDEDGKRRKIEVKMRRNKWKRKRRKKR